MSINLSVPYVPKVPQFDKIHLDFLNIVIEPTDYAKTSIVGRVRLYALNEQNEKVFSQETWDINVSDAEQFATQLAIQSDMRGVVADQHIKSLVALLVETTTTLGNAQVI